MSVQAKYFVLRAQAEFTCFVSPTNTNEEFSASYLIIKRLVWRYPSAELEYDYLLLTTCIGNKRIQLKGSCL